jgi:hypothetical protein
MAVEYFRYKPLPKKLYKVRVPLISTQSEYDISRGTVFTGEVTSYSPGYEADPDKSLDDFIIQQPTLVMLNLDGIIEKFMKGFYVSVVNPNDVIDIYNTLEDYYSGSATETDEIFNIDIVKDDRIPYINNLLNCMFKEHKEAIARSKLNIRKDSLIMGGKFINHVTNFNNKNIKNSQPDKIKPTGVMNGYKVGYMEDDNNFERPNSLSNKSNRDEPQHVENTYDSLYVNRNIPVVDTEYLKNFVRRNKKPGIDLNQFRNNKERQ